MMQIDRYIARSIAVPFFGTLAIAFMLLVIEELMRLLTLLSHTGGSMTLALQMLGFLLPEYLALAIPVSLGLGILLAFRRLAIFAELDALHGAGFGLGRLLRIPYAYAIGCSAALLLVVGFVEPVAAYQFDWLGFRLDAGAAGATIKVGEFTKLGDRLMLRVERSDDHGQSLRGIFLRSDAGNGDSIAATAESGRVAATNRSGSFTLHLHRGRLIETSPDFVTPRALAFEDYDLPIQLPATGRFPPRGNQAAELTLPELLHGLGGTNASVETRRSARAELDGRLAGIAFVLLIPLIAAALAIPPKRSASAIGALLVVLAVVADQRINQYAVRAASIDRLNPEVAVWLPFAELSVLAVLMFRAACGVREASPLAALLRLQHWVETTFRRAVGYFRVPSSQPIKHQITTR